MKEWTMTTDTMWECNGWYIRKEYNRKNDVFYFVGNDDTEYRRAFRYFDTAADFAEKHF